MDPVRLACVRHAASVRPEPGSNSPSRPQDLLRRARPSIGEPVAGLNLITDWHRLALVHRSKDRRIIIRKVHKYLN